jgi:chromate transport protein ChrA
MKVSVISLTFIFFFIVKLVLTEAEGLRYVMKLYTALGIVALGVVAIGSWWIVRESLRDIEKISKEPMPDTSATPEQLEALQSKFKTRR